jgi:uncharacterized phage protein gp47/JayE
MKQIPTTKQLHTRINSSLKSNLDISDSDLKFVLDAVSVVLSGEFKLSYLYLDDIRNQLFPDTADSAENGGTLNRLGQIYLNRQPKPATNGYYRIQVYGVENSFLRTGLTLKSNDDSTNPGKMFISEEDHYLSANEDDNVFLIRSLETGGENILKVDDELTITEPVIGVENTVQIVEIVELPIASESIEEYRKKIIDAIQLEPQGGARTDYRIWAQDAQGVRQVYPYVKENEAGVVQVFVEANKEDSTDGNGTPSQIMLNNVEEVIYMDPDTSMDINDRGRLPMQAILEVLPITLRPVDIDIIGLQENNIEIQALIKNNLDLFLLDVRPFIFGADLQKNRNDILYAGQMQNTISDSLGNNNFFQNFKMYVDGQEVPNFRFSFANIPYLRNINYV